MGGTGEPTVGCGRGSGAGNGVERGIEPPPRCERVMRQRGDQHAGPREWHHSHTWLVTARRRDRQPRKALKHDAARAVAALAGPGRAGGLFIVAPREEAFV